MDSESSGSTPSPPERLLVTSVDTPLSTITNIPKRILIHASDSKSAPFLSEDPENKENIPFAAFLSPGKRRTSSSSSSSSSQRSSTGSSSPRCQQMSKLGVSPAKGFPPLGRSRPLPLVLATGGLFSPSTLAFGQPRRQPPTLFSIFNDNESNERRSSATFAPLLGIVDKDDDMDEDHVLESLMESCVEGSRRSSCVEPGSMEDILTDCSPGKEEGIVPLRSSPDREQPPPPAANAASSMITDDGFDLDTLATIREDSESESPRFDLSALLSKKIILPSHLECSALYQQPPDGGQIRPAATASKKFEPPPRCSRPLTSSGFKRPLFRRALSMLDPPTAADHNSPLSRGIFDFNIPRFKRPNPPGSDVGGGGGSVQPSLSKRRKCSPSSLMSERSSSLEEAESSTSDSSVCRPKFHRSHSENELSIMKSCQLKEEVENILPDSSRYTTKTTKYWVPVFSSVSDPYSSNHPKNLNPDPSYFFTLSENNIKLFHNYKIFSSKEVNLKIYGNVVRSKIIL